MSCTSVALMEPQARAPSDARRNDRKNAVRGFILFECGRDAGRFQRRRNDELRRAAILGGSLEINGRLREREKSVSRKGAKPQRQYMRLRNFAHLREIPHRTSSTASKQE